jgi:cobaltochelatase CobN
MFRNEVKHALLALFLLFSGFSGAGATDISLLLGDTDSVTAIEAARRLRADPALAGTQIHVYPLRDFSSRDLSGLRRSRVVLVDTIGMVLARALAPEIPSIAAQGGKVFAVGATWDQQIEALGMKRDAGLAAYVAAGGASNIVNMVKQALKQEAGLALEVPPPAPLPKVGALELDSGKIFESFDAYRDAYPHLKPGRPWIGLLFYRANAVSGQTAPIKALTAALETKGFNVIPFFGYPNPIALKAFGFDKAGKKTLAALGSFGLKIGVTPDTSIPALKELDIPALNLITLNSQTRAQWEASKQGLDMMERAWQLNLAELAGLVAPTVVASKEPFTDAETGLDGMRETPIPDRIDRAAERLARFVALRVTPNKDKRIAIIYYNYPPGKEMIGASYLNVLPKSLWQILRRLEKDGYDATGAPASEDGLLSVIRDKGGNIGNWKPGSLEQLVRNGIKERTVTLLPVRTYRNWFDRLPENLRRSMIEKWGEPEKSTIMIWHDEKGDPYFVFPTIRYGHILFAPQPSRGWEQDVETLYHDVILPPHHQYLAFYFWLQKEFDAHAVAHIGTHATHEWHGGKEVGFTSSDPGELFAGAVPQFYPFIVDDIGESIQAKRRGMAAMISHLTPPLDKATLHPGLRELKQIISDIRRAKEESPQVAEALRADLGKKVAAQGIGKDLGVEKFDDDEALEKLEDYLEEIGNKSTPLGLHTFGVAPEKKAELTTAEAMLSLDANLTPEARAKKTADIVASLDLSANSELDALSTGFAGRYVPAGPGNDPVRNPDSLPTGRNLYGFDPSRLPTTATWAMGRKLAEDFVADFKKRKGEWPKKLAFNLWGVETNRHEGVMEAQILALLGVKPVWDARGKVTGVEVISRQELQRPRVDVTIVPSGLYRDLFSQMMKLLDDASTLAQKEEEADNAARENMLATKAELLRQGLPEKRAEQLAHVRMFSVPSGAYGTNLDKVTPLSNTYGKGKEADEKIAGVYFMRMHHAFGQGLWGEDLTDRPNLGVDLLRRGLADVQAVIHSRSSNVYGAMDGDDFYQYLGGTALASRVVNGRTPEVFVTDMANPRKPSNITLEKYIGREMRARYLNPKWINEMMKQGYAGARFVDHVVEYMYGWSVTTPEAIGDAKWREMYETWVEDRNHLDIKQKFRDANNLLAYQALVDRMLVAVDKGYWKADPATVANLEKVNDEIISEAGVSTNRDTSSSPKIVALAEAQDRKAMGLAKLQPAPSAEAIAANVAAARPPAPPAPAPPPAVHTAASQPLAKDKGGDTKKVEGFAVEEVARHSSEGPEGEWRLMATVMLLAVLLGFASRFGRKH